MGGIKVREKTDHRYYSDYSIIINIMFNYSSNARCAIRRYAKVERTKNMYIKYLPSYQTPRHELSISRAGRRRRLRRQRRLQHPHRRPRRTDRPTPFLFALPPTARARKRKKVPGNRHRRALTPPLCNKRILDFIACTLSTHNKQ